MIGVMSLWSSSVREAIRRWVDAGLVDREKARVLLAEVEESETRGRRRFTQLAVAGTGGVVLVVAVGAFLAWSWPVMPAGARTAVLVAVALVLHSLGALLEPGERSRALGWVLETTALAVLLVALAYSERAWPDRSPGAVVVGLLCLVVPLVLTPLSVRRGHVMPAVNAAFGYGFLYLFLDRSLGLPSDRIIWALDGVAAASIAVLLAHIVRSPPGEDRSWVLGVLLTSLWAGFVLVLFTGLGPLDLEEDAVFPLDAWLAAVAGLTLWGMHGAPAPLRRPWYGRQLAWTLLLGIPLTFWTFLGGLESSPWTAAAGVGVFGAGVLWYGLREGDRPILLVGCVALVSGAWYLAVERGEGLGAAGALAFTGALLFWVSSRLGSGPGEAAGNVDPP